MDATEEKFSFQGKPIDKSDLSTNKARELVRLLRSGAVTYAKLGDIHKLGEFEVVCLEIEAELPQYPVYDIRYSEPLGILFNCLQDSIPLVWALRKSFPFVPHLNFQFYGTPKSLCLSDVPYSEQQLTWTAAKHLQSIHRWLSLTARGELHQADQPLEQFFFPDSNRIILPSAYFHSDSLNQQVHISELGRIGNKITYAATHSSPLRNNNAYKCDNLFLGFIHTAKPQIHGLIRVRPRTLNELNKFFKEVGDDFLSVLRLKLREWHNQSGISLSVPLFVLIRIPKLRTAGGIVEEVEPWAFNTIMTVAEIGAALGIWQISDGICNLIQHEVTDNNILKIPLELLNPTSSFTREQAAQLNGVAKTNTKFVAVGVGALGSQVINNLIRAGQGYWTLIDDDQLLPHNLARHQLNGSAVGIAKAEALAAIFNEFYEEPVAEALVTNVIEGRDPRLTKVFENKDVILDISASVAVAKHLARDIKSSGKRISLFLNPAGNDIVLLSESTDRKIKLDHLEMEYLKTLIHGNSSLKKHLLVNGERIRYSHACRDVSTTLPQNKVALLSAIGANAVINAVDSNYASIKLWQSHDDFTVSAIEVKPVKYKEGKAGDWFLVISSSLVNDMAVLRSQRLPNETGGVLIGSFDTSRKIIYVVDQIPSPSDSEEWPTSYIRGVKGLAERVEEISNITANQLVYVGEWHSHPKNSRTKPSGDDKVLFSWLTELRLSEGLPPVMAIIGDHREVSWYVDNLGNGRLTITN